MTDQLQLLFLTQCSLSQELGGSKVQLALTEHLRLMGWHVECHCPLDNPRTLEPAYLNRFNVVDWDVSYLISRSLLRRTTLSVCRFPLLSLHLSDGVPWPRTTRDKLALVLDPLRRCLGRSSLRQFEHRFLQNARDALMLADAFAVQNSHDSSCLLKYGVPPCLILQEPCGLSDLDIRRLRSTSAASHKRQILVFVGTFDSRKGSSDLVWLIPRLALRFPSLEFKLLGTNGVFHGVSAVLRHFPRSIWDRLEVIPKYSTEELASHLDDATIGVFPSYLEGFGIAVIEQLAAGIPVLAYASPGPADVLPPDWLVPRGDRLALFAALVEQLARFQAFPEYRFVAGSRARDIASPYRWDLIANRWNLHYRKLLQLRSD